MYTQQIGTIDSYGSRGYLGMSNWTADTIDPSGMSIDTNTYAYELPVLLYLTRVRTSITQPTN